MNADGRRVTAPDSLAVIGGSGAHELLRAEARNVMRLGPVSTPFGLSAPLYRVRLREAHFLFLPRHGETGYEIAAPWVNYRANIYTLKEQGITRIMAWSGPGAIARSLRPGQYVLPSDLIDHTQGREGSFFKGTGLGFIRQHPTFCPELREVAARAGRAAAVPPRFRDLCLHPGPTAGDGGRDQDVPGLGRGHGGHDPGA